MKKSAFIAFVLACTAFVAYVLVSLRQTEYRYGDPFFSVPADTRVMMQLRAGAGQWQDLLTAFEPGDVFSPQAWHGELTQLSAQHPWLADAWEQGGVLCGKTSEGVWWMAAGMRSDSASVMAHGLMEAAFPDARFRISDASRGIFTDEAHQAVSWVLKNEVLFASPSSSVVTAWLSGAPRIPRLEEARSLAATDASLNLYFALDNGDWIQLDPAAVGDEIMLSGYAVTGDTAAHRLTAAGMGTEAFTLPALPVATTTLELWNWADAGEAWQAQSDYFGQKAASVYWNQAWKDLGDSCQCDLNEAMLSWRTGSAGAGVLTPDDSTAFSFMFFPVRDSLDALRAMAPLLVPSEAGDVHAIKYPQVFERNNLFSILVNGTYLMQVGQTVFVAATPGQLNTIRTSPLAFSEKGVWRRSEKNQRAQRALILYQQDELGALLPPGCLPPSWYSAGLVTEVRHFRGNRYRVDLHLANGAAAAEPEVQDTVTTATAPDVATPMVGPFSVINHQTGEKETVYQDSSLVLHLVAADGQSLWTRKLDSPVKGSIYQVDALKNGKLQLFFCTEKAMYCIDRKGNDLDRFPFALPADVSGDCAVFDYDNNRTFRLLVPCADNTLYNYTLAASATEGWKLPKFNTPVAEVLHWKSGGEDYLLAIDHKGGQHILKRNGQLSYRASRVLSREQLLKKKSVIPGKIPERSKLVLNAEGGGTEEIGLEK